MPRFNVTVQALLDQSRSGPHFQLQLDASSYPDALMRSIQPLVQMLAESGLKVEPVAIPEPAKVETPPAE